MIRSLLLALAFSATVGLTASSYSADEPKAPVVENADSAHWASLINSFTDPTLGMASRDEARGDSLKRHPGATGHGAARLTCQVDPTQGADRVKVWKVTVETGTGAGTLRAALDSVDAYDDGTTCQYVIFPDAGDFGFDAFGDPNYDDMQNWRVMGQMAQGDAGANWDAGRPRMRNVHNYGFEFFNLYRPSGSERVSPFSGANGMMNTQKSYLRHIGIAFGGLSGDVAVTYASGTEFVPQHNDTSKQHTVQGMMIGELDEIRPVSVIFGGMEEPDRKQRELTLIGTFMFGPGWRQPNMSSAGKAQFIQNVSYNQTNRAAEFGNGESWDLIDFYDRPGPQTGGLGVQGDEKGWPVLMLGGLSGAWIRRAHSDSAYLVNVVGAPEDNAGVLANMATPDTISYYVSGVRGWQNGYAVGEGPTDQLRGPGRVVACSSGAESWHAPHTNPAYCQADGDSVPMDVTNDSLMRIVARFEPLPLADRAPFASADPMPTEEFTDTVVARVIRFSGNSIGLTCAGEWEFRADSVKTRFQQMWVDSTDAGDYDGDGGVFDGTRSYAAPPGSGCADADDDGLPDEYETSQVGDATSLDPDSVTYNRYAFEWFSDGRHLDGTLVGCEDLSCAAEAGAAQAPPDTIPAFSGAGGQAFGWGATALHDSRSLPLVVHFVDGTETTNGSGNSNDLLDALMATSDTTYDIIMFRTGGALRSVWGNLDAQDKALEHVYVAGQTAPGGGFLIYWASLIHSSAQNYGNDAVVRYLSSYKIAGTAIRLCGDRMMTDHISGGIAGTGGSGNIFDTCERDSEPESRPGVLTFQNSLGAESHEAHPTIMGFSGRLQSGHRNFFAGPSRRLPIMSSDTAAISGFEVTNNIIYNAGSPGGFGARFVAQTVGDFRYNYVKPGPAVQTSPAYRYAAGNWVSGCDTVTRYPDGCDVSIGYSNNRTAHNGYNASTPVDSSWLGSSGEFLCQRTETAGRTEGPYPCITTDSLVPIEYRRDTPIWDSLGVAPYWPYTTRTDMTDAYVDSILADVGNSKMLNCDGTFSARRSAFDAAAIQNFRDSTGLSAAHTFNNDTHRWLDSIPVVATPAAGTPCPMVETGQGRGLYKDWLVLHGFDSTDAGAPPADSVTVSGYLLIETMLNGSDPDDATPWAGSPSSAISPTFGAVNRYVYFVPVLPRFGIPYPDFDIFSIGFSTRNPAGDTVMVVSCTEQGVPADSATVDARLAAWGRTTLSSAVAVRDHIPAFGMGC